MAEKIVLGDEVVFIRDWHFTVGDNAFEFVISKGAHGQVHAFDQDEALGETACVYYFDGGFGQAWVSLDVLEKVVRT